MRRGLIVLAMVLSGCAGGMHPVDRLRAGAIQDVRVYSATLEHYMLSEKVGEREVVEQSKNVIAEGLKDPESARFRNVALKLFEGRPIVCGEVNGKNSYGAYVGYRRFAANHQESSVEDVGGAYPHITAAANAGIYAACL